jgi:hypothetical protein
MAIHGFPRATTDIDILILAEDFEKAKAVAIEQGFDSKGLSLDFDGGKTLIRRISKIDTDTKTLITLDLIFATKFMRAHGGAGSWLGGIVVNIGL